MSVKRLYLGWWTTITMVMPSLAIFLSCFTSSKELVASSPDVGSSRKSSVGHAASSMPTLTRFRWPPLRPPPRVRLPTWTFWLGTSWRTCSTSSVMRLMRPLLEPRGLRSTAEKRMFSRTVMCSWTMSSCGTKPMTVLRSRISASASFTITLPYTSHSLPVVVLPQSTLRNVVFPAPEGPMIAERRCGWNCPQTPFRTGFFSAGPFLTNFMTPLGGRREVPRSSKPTLTVHCFAWMPRNLCCSTRLN
mmetsp:Transcript_64337/g.182508  ORF Transcript_64337/g.182508 Transcript_64337/m.182508 type:complete len:247 (-) Transcript_64337:291-1031(-)